MRLPAAGLAALRGAQWAALQPALSRTPAVARFAGKSLEEFPICETSDVRSDYSAWNSSGLSDGGMRALADAAEWGNSAGELSAGWSTGTSAAQRGLFLTGPAERADYIGQILARLLPWSALLSPQRIALHLRANNMLYSDAGRGRIQFAHFPLSSSHDETMIALAQYQPTILIAPPHRLLDMANSGLRLPSLRHLFCGSEPISAAERATVAGSFLFNPRAILQATEGFLGAECREGRLHLNDHSLAVELEQVSGTPGFRPVITDLRRTSQPVVRFRGDDYLEVDPRPCACGYAGRVIHPVEGRIHDLWHFAGRCITPPQVVAAVEAHLGGNRRWQATATPAGITLFVAPDCPAELAERAATALAHLTEGHAAASRNLGLWQGHKRRKVVWHND